ncbi:MAG: hypothetical protein BWY99_01669 [Synergistetes bacterium ADurb.BinA166]|nr:MAG: hypothetical protein BWY99_01669 [Synergistetes bacterium ADurb.BinA166]
MGRRVYFIGSHSTGKTTMSRYVHAKYGLPLLPEVARLVLAERELSMKSLRMDLDVVNSFQKEIFIRQMRSEEGLDDFVSDRCFDNLAYAAQHSTILKEILAIPGLTEYLERMKRPDTFMFFVRPSRETMCEDGVREEMSWEEVLRIDSMVKFMLEMWDIRYFQISAASMQERARLVDSVLSVSPSGPTIRG